MTWLGTVLSSGAVTAALLAGGGWMFRTWIAGRLNESLRRETESKLIELRSRLDAAEANLSDVRSAGIESNLQLNAAVVAERVAAIKALWAAVAKSREAVGLSMMVSAMDAEYVGRNATHQATSDTMRTMLQSLSYLEFLKQQNAIHVWRPFVSERAWALFAANQGYFACQIIRAVALMNRNQEMANDLWKANAELRLLRATAPAQIADQFAGNPLAGIMPFLQYIESELLAELGRSLRGEHNGPEQLAQAAAIVSAANNALAAASTAIVEG